MIHNDAGSHSRGTDILHDVKELIGINGNITMNIIDIDAGETAGQAYRLYQATFARTTCRMWPII